MSKRLKAMGVKKYEKNFEVAIHEDILEVPLTWKKPRSIFVNSMSDLFHPEVPFPFIDQIFNIMGKAYWHQFQILTKRSERLLEINDMIIWPQNVWIGVSVEEDKYTYRIEHLQKSGGAVKFLSLEPLLGPLSNLSLTGIDWVIVGGESGPGARQMKEDWVLEILQQCREVNVPFFFKQWGGINKKRAGRLLQGKEWNDYPMKSNL
jgi:protein gp37